ncbi:hypothetical protein [Streptomyces sp. NPDC001250]|uniref:hypothetical protein n=1 Tax=unclassified Streptomyces TaxID=2593676 RepID=UPI00331FDCDD
MTVSLDDGETVQADHGAHAVVGVGTVPRTEWLWHAARLDVTDGVLYGPDRGGFIGCEIARTRALDVTITDVSPTLLHRSLGPALGTVARGPAPRPRRPSPPRRLVAATPPSGARWPGMSAPVPTVPRFWSARSPRAPPSLPPPPPCTPCSTTTTGSAALRSRHRGPAEPHEPTGVVRGPDDLVSAVRHGATRR